MAQGGFPIPPPREYGLMVDRTIPDRILRPLKASATRILFIARHAPVEPAYLPQAFPGDGGYPGYYHRIWKSLGDLGYRITTTNRPLGVYEQAREIDLVFSLYNRMPIRNPEIFLTSTCDFLGLPSVGAAANTRALAEDKWFTKLAARATGLPVTEGAVYATPAGLSRPPAFSGPYFVKNRFGAASEGIAEDSVQSDWAGAKRVAQRLMERGMAVLVEEFAPGIDLTVPVLGGEPPMTLGIVQPGTNRANGIITEELKRDDPLGYAMFDAAPGLEAAIEGDVEGLWRVAGLIDYFRLDYRFDPATGRRALLEFNICCHIGRSGAICLAARQLGLEQLDVLGHVVEHCRLRHGLRGAA
jgi:D-alanine-D-alanine ligase